ncbi:MAG: hypothetical protein LC099_11625 [Anaerolineales bacterium]|nr:hypothetical protein [Anaerolineales bacterium]
MSFESAASRTQRFVAVDALLSGYRVTGKIALSSQGATGVLNDVNRSALEIQDAYLARLHMPTKLVDHFEVVRTLKQRVHAVCFARREDVGPQAIVRGGFLNVVEHQIRITTPIFEIEGMMELPGRFDFSSLISEGSREFLPMFNATITAILLPNLRVESAGVLINRKQADLVALVNQRKN